MAIDNNDVKKLAQLTRLALTPEEEAEAVKSLNAVLGLIDQLKSADVEGVDDMAYVHLHGQTLRLREPAAAAGYPPQEVMQNAPQSDEDYFLVPRVIE